MLCDCIACELLTEVNELGFCEACFEKFERDLIRSRDDALISQMTAKTFHTLRKEVIRVYGAEYELLSPPKRKNKSTRSRETKRKRAIASQAIQDYDTDDVLRNAREFIQAQDTTWMNFSYLSQHLHESFYKLKPKRLGDTGKKHKSLLKFMMDYPSDFEVWVDESGVYWIRVVDENE
jgi:hypothetical protein